MDAHQAQDRIRELEQELAELRGRRCGDCVHGSVDDDGVVDEVDGEVVHGIWCQRMLFTWHPDCYCSNWEK